MVLLDFKMVIYVHANIFDDHYYRDVFVFFFYWCVMYIYVGVGTNAAFDCEIGMALDMKLSYAYVTDYCK